MDNLCSQSVLSNSGSIHASRSDFSVTTSSPMLESNATSSTACMADVHRVRQDLSSDLICALCDQLFDRPVMVSCGHSFCEGCIERRTRQTRQCIICNQDVGEFQTMIPSITLDNIVRKVKEKEIADSFDDLFIYDEQAKSKLSRSISTRSQKKRCFFSIAAPTVCSSPTPVVRRRPLSPNAKPTKSSLKMPPDTSFFSFHENDDEKKEEQKMFRRNGYGRRSERFTSSTHSRNNSSSLKPLIGKVVEDDEDKLKRNSLFRRSLNVLRSKPTIRKAFKIEGNKEENQELIDKEIENEEEDEEKKKSTKSLWKRLFGIKKNKIMDKNESKMGKNIENDASNKVAECFQNKTVEIENEKISEKKRNFEEQLGYYNGIGKKFERVFRRNEITIVVFGHSQSGKTTLVKSIKNLYGNNCENDRIRGIPIIERYQMAGIQTLPFPEGDNRLPNFISLAIRINENTEKVIDIIDPEYDTSHLPISYMEACDVALFLVDVRNCASLLSAHQIQRNLKNRDKNHHHIEFELIVNLNEKNPGNRALSAMNCENIAKNMKISGHEMSVNQLEKEQMDKILLNICERVIEARQIEAIEKSKNGILV